MNDDIEGHKEGIARAVVAISEATMYSTAEIVEMAAGLARVGMALGQGFDEIRRCLTAEEGSAYWRRAAKAAARSRANSSNRKRRRHGRAQRTRARR